jgi:hypothetical protein
MQYLTRIRAGDFGVLLLLMLGFIIPASAIAQAPLFSLYEGVHPKIEGLPKPVPKLSFAFRASECYLAGGTAFDMTTTVRSLDHPTTALRNDGTFLAHYYVKEEGWAGIFGRRDMATAVIANVLLNVELDRLSRKLYSRGGRWRVIAYGVVLSKGTLNALAAGGNIRDDGRINQQVRVATGYRGLILWSK